MTTFETFKKYPILFAIGCFLWLALASILMLLAGLAVGLRPENIGKGLAGVILFTFIPGGLGFVRFVKQPRAENSTFELNTPIKRAILLLAPLGLVLMVIAFFVSGAYLEYFWNRVFIPMGSWGYRDGSAFASIILFWTGVTLLLSGLLFSFLYDKTLGIVARWVRGT